MTKHSRSRSDDTERGVGTGSTLFAADPAVRTDKLDTSVGSKRIWEMRR